MAGAVRESAGIYVNVNGAPVDLAEVSWYMKAPCGCISGVTLAWLPNSDHVITTAEQASASFHDTKAERQKYEALGFSCFAGLTSDVGTLLTVKCDHTPRFGYEQPPTPEGWAWARGGYWGNYTRTLHLVPTAAVRTEDHNPDRDHWQATSICGTADKSNWDNRRWETDGRVECKKCIAKAGAAS